jgi:hypothetical protein
MNKEVEEILQPVAEQKAKQVLILGVGIAVGAIRAMVKDIKLRALDIEAKAKTITAQPSYSQKAKKGRKRIR